MSLVVRNFLKYAINLLDKEDIAQDQVEYAYRKWGSGVAERLVELLENEAVLARAALERLKRAANTRKNKKIVSKTYNFKRKPVTAGKRRAKR